MARRTVIRTSSWADPGFVEEWYPDGLPPRERLADAPEAAQRMRELPSP